MHPWTLPVGGQAGIPRALAIDGGDAQNPNGNLWVGLFNERRFYNLQGETGELVRRPGQTNPVDIGHQPYGAVIDSQGVVWSTSLGAGVMPPSTLVGVDSTTGALETRFKAHGVVRTASPPTPEDVFGSVDFSDNG